MNFKKQKALFGAVVVATFVGKSIAESSPLLPRKLQGADSCVGAVVDISCGRSVSGTTVSATNDGPDEACSVVNGENNVWHKISGTDDLITLSTDNSGTSYDTMLHVFEGSCSSLNCIAADDNGGTSVTSELSFASKLGVDYFILVGGSTNLFSERSGSYELSASCTSRASNDDCTAAVVDVACGESVSGSMTSATHDGLIRYLPCTLVNQGNNVWHKTKGTGDIITLSTDNLGTDYDTLIYAFTGSCDNLNCIESNSNGGSGSTSELAFASTAGVEYYIMVGSHFASRKGNYVLSASCTAPVPNDDCAGAAVDLICGGSVSGSTTGATNDGPVEACSRSNKARNVWHKITGTGELIKLSTDNPGTGYGAEIHVFRGTCDNLDCIEADESDGSSADTSEITFASTAGIDYFVLVGGSGTNVSPSAGNYEVSASCLPLQAPSVAQPSSKPTKKPVVEPQPTNAFSPNVFCTRTVSYVRKDPASFWLFYCVGLFGLGGKLDDVPDDPIGCIQNHGSYISSDSSNTFNYDACVEVDFSNYIPVTADETDAVTCGSVRDTYERESASLRCYYDQNKENFCVRVGRFPWNNEFTCFPIDQAAYVPMTKTCSVDNVVSAVGNRFATAVLIKRGGCGEPVTPASFVDETTDEGLNLINAYTNNRQGCPLSDLKYARVDDTRKTIIHSTSCSSRSAPFDGVFGDDECYGTATSELHGQKVSVIRDATVQRQDDERVCFAYRYETDNDSSCRRICGSVGGKISYTTESTRTSASIILTWRVKIEIEDGGGDTGVTRDDVVGGSDHPSAANQQAGLGVWVQSVLVLSLTALMAELC